MTATIPDREPAQLRCGDTWRWTRSLADYPATTWTLKYRYKTASTGFEIVATADCLGRSFDAAGNILPSTFAREVLRAAQVLVREK